MRKTVLIVIALLLMGCQKQPASDETNGKPTISGETAENADSKATGNEADSGTTAAQTQAPADPSKDDNQETTCGAHQSYSLGKCECGDFKLSPAEAVNWDCVDGKFVCDREEGCSQKSAFKTVLRPLENDASAPDKAPVAPTDDDKCKDVICGMHQICVDGQCACGNIRQNPEDAATWECVEDQFRCYRKEGCMETVKKSTVFELRKDDKYDDSAMPKKSAAKTKTALISLDPNAKYPDMPKRKPYFVYYHAPEFDDRMDVDSDVGGNPEYCDGVACDGICRNNICFEAPDEGFEEGNAYTAQGDGIGRPEDTTWVCVNLEGCETKYGNFAFGESFWPTGGYEELQLDSIYKILTDKYPQYDDCLEDGDLSELYNRHFEIPEQYICNDDKQFVCKSDKCCCGRGECSRGEICTADGKCLIPGADKGADSDPKAYQPEPKACGIYAKKKKLEKGELHVDYRQMCLNDMGCACGDTVCPKTAECSDGKCICAGVESPGEGYECKQWKWKCTDPEKCAPEKLYKQPYCGNKPRLGNGYICRMIADSDVPRPKYYNPYVNDNDSHFDKYAWQCASSDGCKCGQTQCNKGESCIDGECFCGRKRALAASGWRCTSDINVCTRDEGCDCSGSGIEKGQSCYLYSRLICDLDEGCDCFGNPKNKGESCFLEEGLFVANKKQEEAWEKEREKLDSDDEDDDATDDESDDLSEAKEQNPKESKDELNADNGQDADKTNACGTIVCPEGTNCINDQCIFYSTLQKLANPGEYISNWGFPQCSKDEGCTCGEMQCKKDEFCHQNTCMTTPTSIEANEHTVEFVPFYRSSGIYVLGYKDKLTYPYWHRGRTETVNHSGKDFVRYYGFERYYRSQHTDTCRGVPYPKDSSGFVCLVGDKEWVGRYDESHQTTKYRYLPDEMGWLCTLEDGCACGKSKCKFKQSCIDQKCYNFEGLTPKTRTHDDDEDWDDDEERDDDEDLDEDSDASYRVLIDDHEECWSNDGCDCGKTRCYKDGSCYYKNKFCYYDDAYKDEYSKACGSDTAANVKVNDNGTCSDGKYLYEPYLYCKDGVLGLQCIKDKCPCGDIQCDKDHYCVEPGRCI